MAPLLPPFSRPAVYPPACSPPSGSITFGILGPSLYGLGLRDSALVILFFCLLATLAPAGLAVFGPKTGMRQMVQARYSFGYAERPRTEPPSPLADTPPPSPTASRHLVSVPVLFNLATLTGFTVISCVVGGQCLSAVSDGRLTPNLGIVIIALLTLLVSFAGFAVLHVFETFAFVAAGVGGPGLARQAQPEPAPALRRVLNFGMIVAGYQIPWAGISSDLTTYFDPRVAS